MTQDQRDGMSIPDATTIPDPLELWSTPKENEKGTAFSNLEFNNSSYHYLKVIKLTWN